MRLKRFDHFLFFILVSRYLYFHDIYIYNGKQRLKTPLENENINQRF